jgi:hypothetical protein
MTDSLIETQGVDNPALDPAKDYYADLVGDGKRFKDNQALAYSKMHADATITLQNRLLDEMRADRDAARAEAAVRARVEDLVKELDTKTEHTNVVPNTTKPEINMSEIEILVANKIQESETQKQQKANLDMVKAELQRRFGNHLEDHLKEVGLNGETAAQLAKVNPQLVLKALGVDKSPEPGFQTPPRNTSMNTPNKNMPQRTWKYYQDLFKANPSLKLDPKTNVQMQKDYIALGNAFEDGDFNRFG